MPDGVQLLTVKTLAFPAESGLRAQWTATVQGRRASRCAPPDNEQMIGSLNSRPQQHHRPGLVEPLVIVVGECDPVTLIGQAAHSCPPASEACLWYVIVAFIR